MQKFALGGFLIGFLAGMLFMQPRGLESKNFASLQ